MDFSLLSVSQWVIIVAALVALVWLIVVVIKIGNRWIESWYDD